MKKILFSLLSCFILFGFSSAWLTEIKSYNFSYDWSWFNPSSFNTNWIPLSDFDFTTSSSNSSCVILFNSYSKRCRIYFSNWGVYSNQCDWVPAWTYSVQYNQWDCTNFRFSASIRESIVPVSSLSPVITWLSNSLSEFIPYIVYIWLAILGATIWFVWIKWLIRWVRVKILWIFKK